MGQPPNRRMARATALGHGRPLVGQDIAEIAHPDAKAGLAVKLFPKRFALLGRHVQGLAGVGLMNEPARRRRAVRVNFLVTGFDLLHVAR